MSKLIITELDCTFFANFNISVPCRGTVHASAIHEAGREVVQGCSPERWHGVRQGADHEADVRARKCARPTAWARPAEADVHAPGYLGAGGGMFYQSGSIFYVYYRISIWWIFKMQHRNKIFEQSLSILFLVYIQY